MLDRIEFLLGEAFTALRRNTWMTFAAISTVAVALFLIGGLGSAYIGINRYAQTLSGRFVMRVFVKDGLTQPQITQLANRIRTQPSVRSVNWVSRERAWQSFRRDFPQVVEGLENPLPNSFEIRLVEAKNAPALAATIQRWEEVEPNGVRYLSDAQQLITESLGLLRWLGIALGGLLLLTGGVLIYNAIRLTIVARRREIRIMRLVGATSFTVSAPLLVEGVVQGAVGGLLASVMLWSAHLGLARMLSEVSAIASLGPFEAQLWVPWLMGVGAAYGFLCSLIAVRDPRRIRG